MTKKNVIYNFRQNDIKNGGEGAPLAPIFHQLLATKYNLDLPICILNIGGISNVTIVNKQTGKFNFTRVFYRPQLTSVELPTGN